MKENIPEAKAVVREMMLTGWRCSARDLCQRLEAEGYSKANSQLAIQRTVEAGHIRIADDLTLVAPNPDYVSTSPRTDRLGRPLRTMDEAKADYCRCGRCLECDARAYALDRALFGEDAPIKVSREEHLTAHGWRETRRGWVKEGGFGKPQPLDSAFQIQTILEGLDND